MLKHSKDKNRQESGEEIFKIAQNDLMKEKNTKMHDLLNECKVLFKYLIDLARANPDDSGGRRTTFIVKAFKGRNIELCDFVPPVQNALSPSFARNMKASESMRRSCGVVDPFPTSVPVMRGFDTHVQVMHSKGERAKRASLLEDENTRDEVREMATDGGYILYPLLS